MNVPATGGNRWEHDRWEHDRWEHGRALYAAGRHWSAHEAWEALWLRLKRTADGAFLQAAIQVAAAMVKAEQGNMAGVRKNLAKAVANLDGLPARCRGVDTRALTAACERCARYAGRRAPANSGPFDWRFKTALPAGPSGRPEGPAPPAPAAAARRRSRTAPPG